MHNYIYKTYNTIKELHRYLLTLLFTIIIFTVGNVQAKPDSDHCGALDDSSYQVLYDLRLKFSDFQEKTSHFISNFVKQEFNSSTKYSVLSIGPGRGSIEQQLLHSDMNIEYLDLIEPNSEYVSILDKKFSKNNKVSIIKGTYEPYSLVKKYDLILMNQVAHFFEEPAKKITDSLVHLNDKGKLVVVLHSDHGMQYFRKKFSAKHKKLGMRDFVTGEEISHSLKNLGVAHKVNILDASLRLDCCLKNTEKCQDLIDFIFNYNFKNCKEFSLLNDIRNNFLQLAVQNKKRLSEPMIVISITK